MWLKGLNPVVRRWRSHRGDTWEWGPVSKPPLWLLHAHGTHTYTQAHTQKHKINIFNNLELDVVGTCNPSTQETETRRP